MASLRITTGTLHEKEKINMQTLSRTLTFFSVALLLASGSAVAQVPAEAQVDGEPVPGARFEKRMERHIKDTDTNGDNIIQKEEFLKKAEERFKNMDTNNDGGIDETERSALREKWKRKMEGRHSGALPE
jgi:hypothetical protein